MAIAMRAHCNPYIYIYISVVSRFHSDKCSTRWCGAYDTIDDQKVLMYPENF